MLQAQLDSVQKDAVRTLTLDPAILFSVWCLHSPALHNGKGVRTIQPLKFKVVEKCEYFLLLGLASEVSQLTLMEPDQLDESRGYPERITVTEEWNWLRPRCRDLSSIPGVQRRVPHIYHRMKLKGHVVM